jgi:hypothetical protein
MTIKARLTSDVFKTAKEDGTINLEIETESVPADMTREQLAQSACNYAQMRKVTPAKIVFIGGGQRAWSLVRLMKTLGFPSFAMPNLHWDPQAKSDPWTKTYLQETK